MAANGNGLAARFSDVVTSEAQLRDILGEPNPRASAKVISIVDDFAARFIAASPFLVLATANAAGDIDISPKGDPAGFVKVLDETTIAIPDRLGNRRLDSFRNILSNADVGLIFLIPGVTHTLRISGKAIIVRDLDLRESMAINGKRPDHAIVVAVERVFSHCPKCMIRSHLWKPDEWPDAAEVPSLADILVEHAKLADNAETIQAAIETDSAERLY